MRLLTIVLLFSVAGLAQQGRAVRAGGGGPKIPPAPRVKADAGPKAKATPQVPKTHAGGTQVLAQLEKHPQLATRVQPLLPEGMPVETAAAGFKNTGQFIAALHVSKNLGIPFADLQALMTGPEAHSLGDSMKALKPELPEEQAKLEIERAGKQAKADEREARDIARADKQ
ncbi:MAG TPA: hypothetical protein VN428_04885 [Bryobacteraceae bacterium]|nr:hypothetical protein [Bryobacteraceae bacterium]